MITQQTKADENPSKREKDSSNSVTVKKSDSRIGHRKSARADRDRVQWQLRGLISAFADEVIKDNWESGRAVNKKNASPFAADVLLRVRGKFYQKFHEQAVGVKAAAGSEASIKPLRGPWTEKLTLDTMRWAYDVKIRLYTDPFGKDIFFCSVCQGAKAYIFDGVVQHFAAKHTKTLSIGKDFVKWAAEWPESPIFDPNPEFRAKIPPGKKTKSPTEKCKPLNEPSFTTKPNSHRHCPCLESRDNNADFAERTAGNVPAYCSSSTGAWYAPPEPRAVPSTPPYSHWTYGFPYPYSPWFTNLRVNTGFDAECCNKTTSIQQRNHGQHNGTPKATLYNPAEQESLMAWTAMDTWHKLTGSKDLPDSIRMCAVIRHAVRKYEQTYNAVAPLRVFERTIIYDEDTLPLRNVTGLLCESCKAEPDLQLRDKTYSLECLLKHFTKQHGEDKTTPANEQLDWSSCIIRLPQMSVLSRLKDMVLGQAAAFEIVSDMFPWAFGLQMPTHEGSGEMYRYSGPAKGQRWPPERPSNTQEGISKFRHDVVPHIE